MPASKPASVPTPIAKHPFAEGGGDVLIEHPAGSDEAGR